MQERTIPNLDGEVEELSREEAHKLVKEHLDPNQGLQLRCFESGHGEWFEYYAESPTEEELRYYREHDSLQKRFRGDVLSTIGRKVTMGDDYVKDITLVPIDRMPKWGDGSIHHTCEKCGAAIIATERTYTTQGTVHDVCDEPSN